MANTYTSYVYLCPATAGVSEAQGADQTTHYQQGVAVRERDAVGQTLRLHQGYKLFLY